MIEETLFLYLTVAEEAINAVLVRKESMMQHPIYYVSRDLNGLESQYTSAEKLAFFLVHVARRLKPYFLAHRISVRTDQPLRRILTKPEASGRLTKWAVELDEYDLLYKSRTTIKAQALTDFIAEFTPSMSARDEASPKKSKVSKLYVDGSSSRESSRVGLLLESSDGQECCYSLRFKFRTSNNEAEYESLIARLTLARKLGAQQCHVYNNLQLVVWQVLSEYEAKEETMLRYLVKVRHLVELFDIFQN